MILPLISVITLVQGQALGEGAEFTWDFRLMTPEYEIKFVPQEIGIIPSWDGATQLVEIIGSRQALSDKWNSQTGLEKKLNIQVIKENL